MKITKICCVFTLLIVNIFLPNIDCAPNVDPNKKTIESLLKSAQKAVDGTLAKLGKNFYKNKNKEVMQTVVDELVKFKQTLAESQKEFGLKKGKMDRIKSLGKKKHGEKEATQEVLEKLLASLSETYVTVHGKAMKAAAKIDPYNYKGNLNIAYTKDRDELKKELAKRGRPAGNELLQAAEDKLVDMQVALNLLERETIAKWKDHFHIYTVGYEGGDGTYSFDGGETKVSIKSASEREMIEKVARKNKGIAANKEKLKKNACGEGCVSACSGACCFMTELDTCFRPVGTEQEACLCMCGTAFWSIPTCPIFTTYGLIREFWNKGRRNVLRSKNAELQDEVDSNWAELNKKQLSRSNSKGSKKVNEEKQAK